MNANTFLYSYSTFFSELCAVKENLVNPTSRTTKSVVNRSF